MAGTASTAFYNWLDKLSTTVAMNVDAIMAPIEQVHTVERVGYGQDAVIFPVVHNSLNFAPVTQGTAYNTQIAFAISGKTITPVPYEWQILVTEHAVRNNPSQYLDIVAREATRAAHQQLMDLLVLKYDDLQTTQAGLTCTVPVLFSGLGNLAASGFNKDVSAVLNPKSYFELLQSVGAQAYNSTPVGMAALAQGAIPTIGGIPVHQDSTVLDSGSFCYNFLGTKDCIGVAFGFDAGIKEIASTDATHIKLGWSYWIGVDVVAGNRGRWLKSTGAS